MYMLILVGLLIVLWKVEPALRRNSVARAAGKLQRLLRELQTPSDFVEVQPQSFPHLDAVTTRRDDGARSLRAALACCVAARNPAPIRRHGELGCL